MCRVMTSNYKNCISENGISISNDKGIKEKFSGKCLQVFATPKKLENQKENVKKYVKEYYKQVLSNLDPNETLDNIPNESILLGYDDDIERHLVAFWFELFLGMTTAEVIENPVRETFKKVDRPEYLKSILEEVIKENYDMNGFNDIKDAYLYNKSNTHKLTLKNNTY